MIDFIQENFELIFKCVMIGLEILFFLILLFVKKKTKNPAMAFVLSKLPIIIQHAEKTGLIGCEKKKMVLSIARDLWESEANTQITTSILNEIDEAIEDILSAPQKKGN